MKHTCPIFTATTHVRHAVVNIYRGDHATFTHVTGFPAFSKYAAERMSTNRDRPVMYRINVKVKTNVSPLHEKAVFDV